MRQRTPPTPPPPPEHDEPLPEPRLVGALAFFGAWASRLGAYGLLFTALLGVQYLGTRDVAFRTATAFLGGVVLFLFLLAFVLNMGAHLARRFAGAGTGPGSAAEPSPPDRRP